MKLNYTPYKIKLNSKEKFEVLKFEGIENFNRPYEYNIQIISSKSDLKLEEFLLTNVTLQMQSAINEKDKFNINGIIKSIKTKDFNDFLKAINLFLEKSCYYYIIEFDIKDDKTNLENIPLGNINHSLLGKNTFLSKIKRKYTYNSNIKLTIL